MTPLGELHRHKGTLQFARKLLTAAIVLELPFVIVVLLRQADLLLHLSILGDRQIPRSVTGVLWAVTSLLSIAGFAIVCRQLSLWEGHLEETELARKTRLLGSRKVAAGVEFFFYLVFLIPGFNLVPTIWARSQASTGIRDLEALMPARRRR